MFDNPLKKDIPLNDKIKGFFPNANLCDDGCQYEGINIEDMTATYACKFNDIANNALIEDNEIINDLFGDVFDFINSSNILVLKCFKYIFKHFSRSIGGWISLILIIVQTSMALLYFLKELGKTKIKLLNMIKDYIQYLSDKGKESINNPPKKPRGISNDLDKQSNNIVISKALEDLEVKSNDIKIPKKILESRNKEENKIV